MRNKSNVGFIKLFDLLGIQEMNFSMKSAKISIFPECINKAVPVDRVSLKANHHIAELYGT